jgi:hypothetical protein
LGGGEGPLLVEDEGATGGIAGEGCRLIAGGCWVGTSTWIKSSSLPDFLLRNFIQRDVLYKNQNDQRKWEGPRAVPFRLRHGSVAWVTCRLAAICYRPYYVRVFGAR